MGIWTAVVCASALAAAQGQGRSEQKPPPAEQQKPTAGLDARERPADAENPVVKTEEKDAFDFDGPTAQVTLSSPTGVAVRGDKSKKISAELSVQAQDRVTDKALTYGDTASLIARFTLDKKDVEVRLRESGFGRGVSNDATKKVQPKDVEGGVALTASGSQPGAPSTVKVWGVAEVMVDGKKVTDSAVVALEAKEQRTDKVLMTLEGLPAELAPGGRMDLRFNDAAIAVEDERDQRLELPPAPVEIALTPEEPTGVGGAGREGEGDTDDEEARREGDDAQGAGPTATQPDAEGAAQSPEANVTATPDTAAGTGTGMATGGAGQATGIAAGGAAAGPGTSPTGIGYPAGTSLGAAGGIAYDSSGLPPAVGGNFTGIGVGGSGNAGDRPDALTGTAGQGTSTGPGASAGATLGGPSLPLSGIDYSGAAGAGPGTTTGAATTGQTFGFGDLGPIDYSAPVGSPGVPAAAAASPGSPSDLGQVNGAQQSPGIPASPPVLNNGRFPEALSGGSGFTAGIPATPGVLNDGSFPLGGTPGATTGTNNTGANNATPNAATNSVGR